jgi:hypothetical protein
MPIPRTRSQRCSPGSPFPPWSPRAPPTAYARWRMRSGWHARSRRADSTRSPAAATYPSSRRPRSSARCSASSCAAAEPRRRPDRPVSHVRAAPVPERGTPYGGGRPVRGPPPHDVIGHCYRTLEPEAQRKSLCSASRLGHTIENLPRPGGSCTSRPHNGASIAAAYGAGSLRRY